MSSVEHLRELISERLTAAAEEIFSLFEKTIEEELEVQRRLLDISWRRRDLTAELQQPYVLKEEVLTDQHLWNQETCSLDQQEPEPVQQDQESLCSNQDAEQLVLKQESDIFMETLSSVGVEQNEPQPNSDWIHFQKPAIPESPDQEEHLDPGSATKMELKPRSDHKTSSVSYSEHHCDSENLSVQRKRFRSSNVGERIYSCSFCGKIFKQNKKLMQHIRIHTDERPFSCKWCGKSFHQSAHLIAHGRIHTGERPYPCTFCDKRFRDLHTQKRHVRSHTGERPYSCQRCGESFARQEYLLVHTKTHTGQTQNLVPGRADLEEPAVVLNPLRVKSSGRKPNQKR